MDRPLLRRPMDAPETGGAICSRCHVWKRDRRVRHCSDCGVCMWGYDHHCPWMGKCVAGRTITPFYTFLGTAFSLLGLVMFCALFNAPGNSPGGAAQPP